MLADNNMEFFSRVVALLLAAPAIVFGFGVVWRVEKKLDLAFKLFLGAIVIFFAGEVSGFFFVPENSFWAYFAPGTKIVFALFFLAGMAEMRNMIRKIDGEK
jgi:hypothetical protein